MRIIHWFRRDLRLIDNPALHWAAEHASELTLVYIWAPEEEAPWEPGAASRWWLQNSLEALQKQLASAGQKLLLLRGPTDSTLRALARDTGAQALSWNCLYEPAVRARDLALRASLEADERVIHTANSQLLIEPWAIANRAGAPYRVFTPYWRAVKSSLSVQAVSPAPQLPPAPDGPAGLNLDELDIASRHDWTAKLAQHWRPGEQAALTQLDNFAAQGLGSYATQRDFPGKAGVSRLSAHLHWGELGPSQIVAALLGQTEQSADLHHPYMAQLGWREFAHHLLHHFPASTHMPLNKRFRTFGWRELPECQSEYQRWCQGRTGIDIIDAAMQELWQTGWMHNRMRMLVGSLLTKNLGVHWQLGARWFWDTLVDANLANNSLGWQWIAGCGADAAPYFRIFNPDTQADKFDAQGEYRRRWLAATQARPASRMVDLRISRAQALERYGKIRNPAPAGEEP